MPIHFHREKNLSAGPLGGGCLLWLVALAIWGISALIFPKLPGYDDTLANGERVQGQVVRVAAVGRGRR
jgi:hypothetical protein